MERTDPRSLSGRSKKSAHALNWRRSRCRPLPIPGAGWPWPNRRPARPVADAAPRFRRNRARAAQAPDSARDRWRVPRRRSLPSTGPAGDRASPGSTRSLRSARARPIAGTPVQPRQNCAAARAASLRCSPKTLRKRCRDDLDCGVAEANAIVSGSLFAAARSGNVVAQILWLKTRAQWRERAAPRRPGCRRRRRSEFTGGPRAARQRPRPGAGAGASGRSREPGATTPTLT